MRKHPEFEDILGRTFQLQQKLEELTESTKKILKINSELAWSCLLQIE
jgi:hypothetical protein